MPQMSQGKVIFDEKKISRIKFRGKFRDVRYKG